MLRLRIGALIAAGAIAFAACSGATTAAPSVAQPSTPAASSGTGGSTAPSTAPSGPTPVNGGTWIFGSASDPTTLDAILIQDGESFRIAQQIYETLIKLKPGSASDLLPGLAKSWDTSSDGLTYTFHLQTGVNFSDGTPFNADAAVYNVNRWKNLPAALQGDDYYDVTVFGGYGDNSLIKTVTKVDDSTFSLTLTKPKADFLTAMTLIPFAMQSPTALQAHHADLGSKDPTNDYWQKAPTGTGPFMFSEFVPGDHYTIVKNPNYWDTANAAHLDKIIFQPIADSANRLTALQSGTVDTIDFVDATQLKQISADTSLQLITRPPLDIGKLAFNQTQKPWNDIKVREAAALAIDKSALVNAFFPNGAGSVADSDLINNMPAYEPNTGVGTFDAAAAKTMLASSTCPPPCAITFWYPDSVSRPYMLDPKGEYEAIKPMLEAAGFVVTPNHKPWHGGYLTDEANGVYPLFFIGWIYDYADPADGPGIFYATSTADCNGVKETTPHNCEFGEDNPAVATAMAKAIAEPDLATRTQDWKDAMKIINADVPDIPLVWAGSSLAATTKIHGYIPSPTQTEYFNLVWKDAGS
ncbi:MAG TPA: ABC transporter substrate-binding protein [Candidatus Limnocylindrales bacterium]|jgi:peptide/nickel transport system substrate-binding protein